MIPHFRPGILDGRELSVQWEREKEDGSTADLRFHPDFSLIQLDDLFDDGESDAGPGPVNLPEPLEGLEQPSLIFGRNPNAADRLFLPLVLSLALLEALALYGFVIAIILTGKI